MVLQIDSRKPVSLPAAAVWSEEHRGWELSARDANGERHGECLVYREDGTLALRCEYCSGTRTGAFSAYHPNGEVAQRGAFRDGLLDGVTTKYASHAPGGEPLRPCCVPAGAVQLRTTYTNGLTLREVFYDREGQPLGSDGSPWPPRAAGISDDAGYESDAERWCLRTIEGTGVARIETLRYWSVEGRLLEVLEYRANSRSRVQRFHPSGAVAEELHYADGPLHGPYFRSYEEGQSPYLDTRILSEEGEFEQGRPSGTWRYLDGDSREIRAVERGTAPADLFESLVSSEAHSSESEAPETPWQRALELLSERRVREALCFAARGASRTRDSGRFLAFLNAHVVRLRPELEARRGDALAAASAVTSNDAIDALLTGADPAAALRTLAAVFPSTSGEALDLVEAALLLAPERTGTYLTRALIRLERGDDRGARADADLILADSPSGAEFIHQFARIHCPDFSFWPSREELVPDPGLVPVSVEQPLDRILHIIGVYATRLSLERAALRACLPPSEDSTWLPPDVSALLPDGPVALFRGTATITEESEEGELPGAPAESEHRAEHGVLREGDVETTDVQIDETLDDILGAEPGDGLRLSVPRLMAFARADWSARWLCWAVGLDRVALPPSIEPREAFPQAVNQATQRCWRAHDRLNTGGLLAMTRNIPGFTWEGHDIDTLHPRLAEVPAREYLEIRAMFFWLMFPENISPFQDDLRRI